MPTGSGHAPEGAAVMARAELTPYAASEASRSGRETPLGHPRAGPAPGSAPAVGPAQPSPSSSSRQVTGMSRLSESRTEQYFVTASSIARSACPRSIPAPRSR